MPVRGLRLAVEVALDERQICVPVRVGDVGGRG
jgi:hypothetical protein